MLLIYKNGLGAVLILRVEKRLGNTKIGCDKTDDLVFPKHHGLTTCLMNMMRANLTLSSRNAL